MKLKKLEQQIKRKKEVAIMETNGGLWLGTLQAMYAAYNLEPVTFDQLMVMFDVPEDKRESFSEIYSELLSRANTDDTDSSEIELQRVGIQIVWHGKPLLPLSCENKEIYYIDQRTLDPVSDAADGITLYRRKDDTGRSYIAIKSGMLLLGLIEPEPIVDEMLLQYLKCLYDRSAATFQSIPLAEDPQERIYG